jgi:hypothetical protein
LVCNLTMSRKSTKSSGVSEFRKADVSHRSVDLGPIIFSLIPLFLDPSMRLLGHSHPVFSRFIYAVDATISEYLNVMLFNVSALLNDTDVVDPFHGLVCFLIPPLHIFTRFQCHEGVFLVLGYSCSEHMPLVCKFIIGFLELVPQEHCDLCGILVIIFQMVQMF